MKKLLKLLHYIYRHFYMEISKLIEKRAIVFHNRIAPNTQIFI